MQAKQLGERLSEWVEHGLLSGEQKDRILEFESARADGGRRSWVLYGLLMLGASVIGIGVVSLIAANWDQIPAALKLVGAFGVLGGLAFAAYRAHDAGQLLRFDLFAALLCLGVLGTIGLVAQVYHTGGQLFMALGLWVVAIAPVAHLRRGGFLPQLWVAASLAAFLTCATSLRWWKDLGLDIDDDDLAALVLGVPALCLLLSNVGTRWPSWRAFSRGYAFWSHLGAILAVFTIDVFWSVGHPDVGAFWLVPSAVVAVLAAVTLWLRDDIPGKGRLAAAVLIGLSMVAFLPFALGPTAHYGHRGYELAGAAFSVVALLLLAAVFAARDARRAFNTMTVLVGLRLLIVYLQVIGSLAMTGLGLVVSGAVIIGVALLWFKTRGQMAAFFGGLVK